MEDLLSEDSTMEIVHGDGDLLIMRKAFDIKSIPLGDRITLAENRYRYGQSLGALKYDIPEFLNKDILTRDLFPAISVGTAAIGAYTNPSAIDIIADSRQYFEEATFESGTVTIVLTNNMPIPVTFPEPAKLLDNTGRVLGSTAIPGTLQPGESRSLPQIILQGVTIKNQMTMQLRVATPGSGGQSVTLKSTHGLNIKISIEKTKILSAVAFLPSQQSTISEAVDITNNDGSSITSGKIKYGTLRFNVQNYIAVGTDLNLTIEGMTDAGGLPIQRQFRTEARAGKQLEFNLAGYNFAPLQGKYIKYTVAVVTDEAKQKAVLIKAVDSVTISATLYGLIFEEMQGTLSPRFVAVDQSQNINFDFTSKLNGELEFSNAKMWAVLRNQASLPVQIDNLKVTGIQSSASTTAVINVPGQRIQGGAETLVDFNSSEVLNFLNTFSAKFPDKLDVQGSVTLNPDGLPGRASTRDSISGTIYVEIPMQFQMKSGVITDTSAVDINKDNKKRFDEINSGSMTFEMENHLPTEMVLESAILDNASNILFEPRAVGGGDISVPSGELDNDGRVSKAVKSSTTIQFAAEEFKKMVVSKWILVRLRMKSNTQKSVAFRTTDYIKVRAYATLNVNSNIMK